MEQETARGFPDPAHDPEFSSSAAAWSKSEPGSRAHGSELDPGRGHQFRFRPRIWALSLLVLGVWMALLLDLALGRLVLGVLLAFGLGLAVIVGTMALGIMGHGVFAAGDRVIAWLRKSSRWPDE